MGLGLQAPSCKAAPWLDTSASLGYVARIMKIRNSLRAAKTRDKNCRVVRRHGRVYIINKKNPRMKCRQG